MFNLYRFDPSTQEELRHAIACLMLDSARFQNTQRNRPRPYALRLVK